MRAPPQDAERQHPFRGASEEENPCRIYGFSSFRGLKFQEFPVEVQVRLLEVDPGPEPAAQGIKESKIKIEHAVGTLGRIQHKRSPVISIIFPYVPELHHLVPVVGPDGPDEFQVLPPVILDGGPGPERDCKFGLVVPDVVGPDQAVLYTGKRIGFESYGPADLAPAASQ